MPLFGLHSGYKALMWLFFLQHLCLAVSQLGLDMSQYAGHSFCQGAATWAVSQGVDAKTIKLLGQWNLDCYCQYVNCSAMEQHALVALALYLTCQGPLVPTNASWHDPVL